MDVWISTVASMRKRYRRRTSDQRRGTGTDGYVEVHGLVTDADVAMDNTKVRSSVVGYYTRSGESEPYTYSAATGYAVDGVTYYKQAVKGNIAAGIGTIGDVFGGGNRGNIIGDATVNIGTETTVTLETLSTDKVKNVLGAHITGDVFNAIAKKRSNLIINVISNEITT